MSEWTFITNHGAVLALVAEHGQITARDIGMRLNLAERSVHRIIGELESEGYIDKQREGRLNYYRVRRDMPLRREDRRNVAVGSLLKVLIEENQPTDGDQGSRS